MNIVSFGVKFQNNSVNDGQVLAGGIYTMFLPVKYSRVMVTTFLPWRMLSTLHGHINFHSFTGALKFSSVNDFALMVSTQKQL